MMSISLKQMYPRIETTLQTSKLFSNSAWIQVTNLVIAFAIIASMDIIVRTIVEKLQ